MPTLRYLSRSVNDSRNWTVRGNYVIDELPKNSSLINTSWTVEFKYVKPCTYTCNFAGKRSGNGGTHDAYRITTDDMLVPSKFIFTNTNTAKNEDQNIWLRIGCDGNEMIFQDNLHKDPLWSTDAFTDQALF